MSPRPDLTSISSWTNSLTSKSVFSAERARERGRLGRTELVESSIGSSVVFGPNEESCDISPAVRGDVANELSN